MSARVSFPLWGGVTLLAVIGCSERGYEETRLPLRAFEVVAACTALGCDFAASCRDAGGAVSGAACTALPLCAAGATTPDEAPARHLCDRFSGTFTAETCVGRCDIDPVDRTCNISTGLCQPSCAVTACSNGADDDRDGKVDFPADEGCGDPRDGDEAGPNAASAVECTDEVDNDGDGLIDDADPGCMGAGDTAETCDPCDPACLDVANLAACPPTGLESCPLRFASASPQKMLVLLTALDAQGKLLPAYESAARISVVPGKIDETQSRVKFTGGKATVLTDIRFSYGDTHVWIEDVGEDPPHDCGNTLDDDEDGLINAADPDCLTASGPAWAKATLATGISSSLFFAEPRIHDLQFSPRCTTDTPLSGQNVDISTGTLICTGTTQSGMYVTDLAGPEGGYNSVFLFTYSNPGGVKVGDRLCDIAGNAAEFIGNSQLNFPSFVNADIRRQIAVEGQTIVPCSPPEPERTGPDALPLPHTLTALDVKGGLPAPMTSGDEQSIARDAMLARLTACGATPAPLVVPADPSAPEPAPIAPPPDFYRVCGPGDTALDIENGADCEQAVDALTSLGVPLKERKIDCRRDNFAMEPWEHALVAFDDLTVGDRIVNCDVNADGDVSYSVPEEGDCAKACAADPLCTEESSLKGYGQFAAGINCCTTTAAVVPGEEADAGVAPPPDRPVPQCAAKIYVSTRDTLGSSGYDVRRHLGEGVSRIVGHIRQTQPGAGVETIWILEPRSPEDFVSGDTQ